MADGADDTIALHTHVSPSDVDIRSRTSSHQRWAVLIFGAREFDLSAPETIIGRSRDADIVIESQAVSRRHARIRMEGEQAIVDDLHSKNGTYVNGVRLDKPSRISDGNHLRLGPIWLTYRLPPPEV
jgi:pSer/pThr/pTyr-binding forkhead associated (FHA) protein